MTKAAYTHGALVALTNANDELLLVRQRLRERGCWGLPGGFLRRGEEAIDGARRELFEETRVQKSATELELCAHYKQPWAWHYEHLYRGTIDGDGTHAFRSLEIRGCGWFAKDDLPDKLTMATREALVRLLTVA